MSQIEKKGPKFYFRDKNRTCNTLWYWEYEERNFFMFIETKKIYFVVKIIRMTTNGTRKRQRRDLFSFFLFTKYFFRKTTFFFFIFFWNVRCMLWYVFFCSRHTQFHHSEFFSRNFRPILHADFCWLEPHFLIDEDFPSFSVLVRVVWEDLKIF